MKTIEEYHEAATSAMGHAERATDIPGATGYIAAARVYAELAKTAPRTNGLRTPEQAVAEQARLTQRAIPRVSDVLEEGAPEGWRWAGYSEVDDYLTDEQVDEMSNKGIQVMVQVDR